MTPHDHPEWFVAVLAFIGAAIGLGKLLNSEDQLTARRVAGRFIVNAGIGAAAGSVMLWVPNAPPLLLYGMAAGLASLGTSTLEYVIKAKLSDSNNPPMDKP
jgi:hypothetical protein